MINSVLRLGMFHVPLRDMVGKLAASTTHHSEFFFGDQSSPDVGRLSGWVQVVSTPVGCPDGPNDGKTSQFNDGKASGQSARCRYPCLRKTKAQVSA